MKRFLFALLVFGCAFATASFFMAALKVLTDFRIDPKFREVPRIAVQLDMTVRSVLFSVHVLVGVAATSLINATRRIIGSAVFLACSLVLISEVVMLAQAISAFAFWSAFCLSFLLFAGLSYGWSARKRAAEQGVAADRRPVAVISGPG